MEHRWAGGPSKDESGIQGKNRAGRWGAAIRSVSGGWVWRAAAGEVGAAGRADQGLVGEGAGLGSPSAGQL